MRVSNCQPNICEQRPETTACDLRQACTKAERDPGRRKVQLVQLRLSCTEEDINPGLIVTSVMNQFSSEPCYQSSIHHEVPQRFSSSILFLDKSLCISLEELERRRSGRPAVYRSAMFIPLGVSSAHRSQAQNKPAKTNEGYRKAREAMSVSFKCSDRASGSSNCRGPLSKHWGRKVRQTAPTHDGNSKADDSDMQRRSSALGLLSFREPDHCNTKPARLKENADKAALSVQSNFRQKQHTFSTGPVDPKTCSVQSGADKTENFSSRPHRVLVLEETHQHHCRKKSAPPKSTSTTLSLKEALELFRPDFISRSQGRVRSLEQRAWRRKAMQSSTPDLLQCLRDDQSYQKRNCTIPDPLSDNLFKPRERSISGREMQLRSRRIYNKLPEVTKKKEEEKRRAVSQTNRQRAEVFKKGALGLGVGVGDRVHCVLGSLGPSQKLLDQILQR
ncbi:uncharacterized protein LOC114476922 [Gouania willdenowi]|uniref:uncharacterized protein LOC114476922 n=1 Tax=Gouania willdenowi TaxID=441366 RepID=UPI00105683DC|nr:uncharacterized protein LOC114476922 [Gouania willdenowi]